MYDIFLHALHCVLRIKNCILRISIVRISMNSFMSKMWRTHVFIVKKWLGNEGDNPSIVECQSVNERLTS